MGHAVNKNRIGTIVEPPSIRLIGPQQWPSARLVWGSTMVHFRTARPLPA